MTPRNHPLDSLKSLKYNANFVIVEGSGIGKPIVNALLKHEGSRRWLLYYEPTLGKVERAIAQTPKLERKYVYLPTDAEWLEIFEAELAAFPLSKFADQVDSMVHFLFALDGHNILTYRLSEFPEKPKAIA
jgi:predicted phage terminase large subunit-like protein